MQAAASRGTTSRHNPKPHPHPHPHPDATWHNEQRESGLPYDISIATDGGGGGEETTYVEVKTTKALEKPVFEVSMPELEFAKACGAAYHLYRVSGAGTADVSIACVPDPLQVVSSGAGSIALVLAARPPSGPS